MESDNLATMCVEREGVKNSSQIKLWAVQTFPGLNWLFSYSEWIPEFPLWTEYFALIAVGSSLKWQRKVSGD